MIVLVFPIIFVIFISYLVSGRFDFIFRQDRIGKNEHSFIFYKFKTLNNDFSIPIKNREFPFGRFLRKTSLDELPQLWNILKGEMSFVGPRPLPMEYLPYFSQKQKKRFLVKPGLTGWAQVNGRTSIDWDKKLALDVDYVEKQLFWLDLKILLKTVKVVLFETNGDSLEEESFIDYCERKTNPTAPPRSPKGEDQRAFNSIVSEEVDMHYEAKGEKFVYTRKLRNTETSAEKVLWNILRNKQLGGFKFRRQHPIKNYIADFYCHAARLVIEVDGEYHLSQEQQEYDGAREHEISQLGLEVIRFSNNQVITNLEKIKSEILLKAKMRVGSL